MVKYAHKHIAFLRTARQRKIGLFGGSFDPVHWGHFQCAEGLRKALGLHQVWWLPVGQNPLKKHRIAESYERRVQKIEGMIQSHPYHCISPLWLDSNTFYTIDFLKFIQKVNRNNRCYLLAGSDILTEIHRWKHWAQLNSYSTLAVYSRPGNDVQIAGSPAVKRLVDMRFVLGKRNSLASRNLRS